MVSLRGVSSSVHVFGDDEVDVLAADDKLLMRVQSIQRFLVEGLICDLFVAY